jgi:hypothetical protein
MKLPTEDLRSNLGTWAVAARDLPAVAHALLCALPVEPFDADFRGQDLETTYFDTNGLSLRRARLKKKRYLTLRIRRYPGPAFALSAKTDAQKFRRELETEEALALLGGFRPEALTGLLPADLVARLYELIGDADLVPVAAVSCRRFAVENVEDRFTLDVSVCTDAGKRLATNVLEFKSTNVEQEAIPPFGGLRPIKLSKFLWATTW